MKLTTPILIALLGAASAGPAVAQAKPDRFNGPWTVRMVKDTGLCDKDSFRYAIVVRDGSISYRPDPGDAPLDFSGSVGPAGEVQINASRSLARVSATGQLRGNGGSGTWRLPLLACSGRWTAQRSGPVQASSSR